MDDANLVDQFPYLFLPRPKGQLGTMPVNFRWEVTRRHPIYLRHWQSATTFYEWKQSPRKLSEPGELAMRLGELAATLLRDIGVTSPAPDPSREFNDIGEGIAENGWSGGSISPVTLRGIWGLLIANLSAEQFAEFASRIVAAMADAGPDPVARKDAGLAALQQIHELPSEQLLDEPMVYINPGVADRQINRDLNPLLARWRKQRGIEVGRDRSDRYPDYLRVWDLREGWSSGSYSPNERTMDEVANELKIKATTVNARYRSAFQLITGHKYSAAMWVRFMGIEKLSSKTQQVIGRVARNRPTKVRTKRETPSSTLGTEDVVESIADMRQRPGTEAATQLMDLVLDIEALLFKGKTAAEIQTILEIPEFGRASVNELIEIVRSRR